MSIPKASIDKASQELLNHVIGYLDTKSDQLNEDFSDKLAMLFIARLVGVLLLRELSYRPVETTTKEKLYEFTRDNYTRFKERIEHSISDGFSGGMSTYSGKDVEYYTQIKTVPTAKSNYIC